MAKEKKGEIKRAKEEAKNSIKDAKGAIKAADKGYYDSGGGKGKFAGVDGAFIIPIYNGHQSAPTAPPEYS